MPEIDFTRLVSSLVLIGVVFYLTVCAGLFVWQRRIIFLNTSVRPDPVVAGVPGVRVMQVHTSDGLDLNAWYQPPADVSKPVALFFHGNSGHIGHRAGRLGQLAAVGWGMLLLEYRGFGGNAGSPSEEGLDLDARAGYAALRAMGIDERRIVLWGESLGTAVGVRLATEVPAAALILEAPFTSMTDIARYHFVPVNLLLRDRFDSLSRIPAVRMPLLVMHGTDDTMIPMVMAERLMAAATVRDREYRQIADGQHNDLAEHGVVEAAVAFVEARQAH